MIYLLSIFVSLRAAQNVMGGSVHLIHY